MGAVLVSLGRRLVRLSRLPGSLNRPRYLVADASTCDLWNALARSENARTMSRAKQLGLDARLATIRSLDRLGIALFCAWAVGAIVVTIVRPGFLLEAADGGDQRARSSGARCAKRARRVRSWRSSRAARSYPC